jgi:hypothetical protein
MDFDPRDDDSRDDDRLPSRDAYGDRQRDDEARSVGRGPGNSRESENDDRGSDRRDGARCPDRERAISGRGFDSREPFTRDLDLPSGQDRELCGTAIGSTRCADPKRARWRLLAPFGLSPVVISEIAMIGRSTRGQATCGICVSKGSSRPFGHASITTTQRYMNARATSLATSMRAARERRKERLSSDDQHATQVG